jgi:hypothetical protein
MERAGRMPCVTHVAKSQRTWASERGKNSEQRARQAAKKNQGRHRKHPVVARTEAKKVLKAPLKRRK